MDIQLRNATIDDRDEIVGMLCVHFVGFKRDCAIHPTPSVESAVEYWEREIVPGIESGDAIVLIAENELGLICGFSFWKPHRGPTETLYRTVHGFTFVKEEHRRQGVATRLRHEAAHQSLERGFEVLYCTVEVGDRDALNSLPGEPLAVSLNVQTILRDVLNPPED